MRKIKRRGRSSADFEFVTAVLLKIQVLCNVRGLFIYKFKKIETLLGLLYSIGPLTFFQNSVTTLPADTA